MTISRVIFRPKAEGAQGGGGVQKGLLACAKPLSAYVPTAAK